MVTWQARDNSIKVFNQPHFNNGVSSFCPSFNCGPFTHDEVFDDLGEETVIFHCIFGQFPMHWVACTIKNIKR